MIYETTRLILILAAIALVAVCGPAAAGEAAGAVDAQGAFAMLKGLAGQWSVQNPPEGSHEEGGGHVFRISANDSVVMETMSPGTEHEMINMYHLDGDDLVLTHYCASGNQPHLKLDRSSASARELRFAFTGGTNLDPAKNEHIHAASIVFVDDDHIRSGWTGYQDGTEAGVMVFELARTDTE